MVFDIVSEVPDGHTWSYLITLEDVARTYPPRLPLGDYEPKHDGPVIAFGRAVYETQPQEATDSLLRLNQWMCTEFAPGNLWLLPTYERLPYPWAVYWPLACAFLTEKKTQRRFDWYIWIDDDVLVKPSDIQALLKAADPVSRPFVSALGYDRWEPHNPAVTEEIKGVTHKWIKAPASGTHAVDHTGLCLAIFHRSIFDRVREPWFGCAPPMINSSGTNPDWWWSIQMRKSGLTPYVCCDTDIIHLGRKLHVNRDYSEQWRAKSSRSNKYLESSVSRHIVSELTGATTVIPSLAPNGRNVQGAAEAVQ